MNQPEKVWPLLKHSADPRVRSYLIHRFGPLEADAGAILKHLDEERDITIRRALVLSLGEFNETQLPPPTRTSLLSKLQVLYRTEADPGLHGAVEWLLRHWEQEGWLKQVNEEWAKDKDQRDKRLKSIQELLKKDREKTPPQWYVNGQGQTMVVIPGPVEFLMGSPVTEAGRAENEIQHKKRIGRTFAVAAKSVTMEQYQKFARGYNVGEAKYHRAADLPAVNIDWYIAASYCNWLSEQEGIPETEWCYETEPRGKTGPKVTVVRPREKYLGRSGYRLPTEAEMEYAARAGSVTSRYFGETEELLRKYAWYDKNSDEKPWAVGIMKPNDLGLFDVQGNVWTRCQESFKDYPALKDDDIEDKEDNLSIVPTTARVLRGGSFYARASGVRSAYRYKEMPTNRLIDVGFRPARTLPLGSFTALPPSREGGRK